MGSIGIPAVFLGIQIVVASMVGYYPFDDIYGYGKQVFIRVEKKSKWWLSKCAWTFMTVLSFYVILYAVMVYDILGILVISRGLMANYTMIFRDKMVSGADIEPVEGIIYMLIPMVICVFVGMAVIKRKEIFEK